MREVNFTEEDDKVVNVHGSIPEDTLRILLCRNEDAMKTMNELILNMSIQVAEMTEVIRDNIPVLSKRVMDASDSMDRNTSEGIATSEKLIEVLEEVSDGLQRAGESER
jgi:uncharacterized protein Yka (UPF0111/DUF47 family)